MVWALKYQITFKPSKKEVIMSESEPIGSKKKMSLTKKILIGFGVIVLIGIISKAGGNKGSDNSTNNDNNSSSAASETKTAPTYPGIGQVLNTEYFAVTINSIHTSNRVNTGNEFADLKPESGNKYLILNATFKNIDKESRMLTDGTVWVTYNGKDYQFDKAETIMADGWGLMLDQINPLTSKTTNLVYKIPEEVKGPAYFQPGRAGSDDKISLGNL
jgi:hypothetical protein